MHIYLCMLLLLFLALQLSLILPLLLLLQSFAVSAEVRDFYNTASARAATAEAQWNQAFSMYSAKHPQQAADFLRRMAGELPADADWADKLPGNPEVRNVCFYTQPADTYTLTPLTLLV